MTVPHTLVLACGNPAREDDGIGPAAAEYLENLGLKNVTVEADYQLTVEDAAAVAEHDLAVFIDADAAGEGPYFFSRIEADEVWDFSTHSVSPGTVAALANTLAGVEKECYVLGIRGYSFAMYKEQLTESAKRNLGRAMDFLVPLLRSGNILGGCNERRKASDTGN